MSLNDGSKEVENGESLIYFAACRSMLANEIVPTPLCVPCVGICAVTYLARRRIA